MASSSFARHSAKLNGDADLLITKVRKGIKDLQAQPQPGLTQRRTPLYKDSFPISDPLCSLASITAVRCCNYVFKTSVARNQRIGSLATGRHRWPHIAANS